MSTPKAKHVTRTSVKCQDTKGMATVVCVQLTREGIRPGEWAPLETSTVESLGPGKSLAIVGSSQKASVQVRHHKQVLF